MRANGTNKHQIRDDNFHTDGADWSPGGQLIVYKSRFAFKIVRTDGTFVRRIPTPRATNPVWSPDGRWIAYIHGRSAIKMVSPDGSITRTVAPFWGDEGLSALAWQPVLQ
jgi:Tol biopolymer transport system component